MQTVSIKQLRDNLAQIIEETAIAKKRFKITKFGKSKAAIVPIEVVEKKKEVKKRVDFRKLPGFGMWKNRKDMKNSAKWVRKIRESQSMRLRSS